jgi:hypothetical protein
MATSVTVPVTVTPEAAAHISDVGLQDSVKHIIELSCSMLSDLERVRVDLYDRYELGEDSGVCIDLYGRKGYERCNSEERSLVRQLVTEFPPEVLQRIIVDYHPGTGHAR